MYWKLTNQQCHNNTQSLQLRLLNFNEMKVRDNTELKSKLNDLQEAKTSPVSSKIQAVQLNPCLAISSDLSFGMDSKRIVSGIEKCVWSGSHKIDHSYRFWLWLTFCKIWFGLMPSSMEKKHWKKMLMSWVSVNCFDFVFHWIWIRVKFFIE